MQPELVQIANITERKTINGKNGPFSKINIQDGRTGRMASAIGAWTDAWKIGDQFEAVWEQHPKYGWQLIDPARAARQTTSGGAPAGGAPAGGATPQVSTAASASVHAFMIASTLAPYLLAAQGREASLDNVTKLAEAVKEKLQTMDTPAVAVAQPLPVQPAAPIVPAVPAPTMVPAPVAPATPTPAATVAQPAASLVNADSIKDDDGKPF